MKALTSEINHQNEKTQTTGVNTMPVQCKLTVGAPGDTYEQEADAMAEKVMRMPDQNFVQRKCVHCEEEEKKQVRRKPLSDSITPFIQAKSDNATAVSNPLSNKITSSQGSGNGMDSSMQSFMSSRFGADFSGVKIHTDSEAIQMNRELNAKAFTVGNDIYFNKGQYQPGSDSGKHLLAHELTHTLQQKGGKHPQVQKVDDASYEAGVGVDRGITSGTMTADAINAQTYTVNCGFRDYTMTFKISKAYKGTYPYAIASRDVRGVYVKIEASITDHRYCGRCTPMKLLQTVRKITRNSSGNMESADWNNAVRNQRSGWGNASAPSRGWMVDRVTTATVPYYTSGPNGQEGSETSPAILWDAPGFWTTDSNVGMEFYTCAVCTNAANKKWVAACVSWGFYTDSSGNISFRPATPVTSCRYTQEVRDASERWDAISGNTATGITF